MREPFELHDRVAAAQSLLDAWKGRTFTWGEADCLHLFMDAMDRCSRPIDLGDASYASLAGAVRLLKAKGHASLEDAIDAHGLKRIAPAAALPCDLVALKSEIQMPALTVALGNGRVLGFWSPGEPLPQVAQVLAPKAFVTAWRA